MPAIDFVQFCGRKTNLDILKKRVLDLKEGYRQNIAFIGKRSMGKTMMVQKFFADLDDKDVIYIYLNLEHGDFDYFYHKLIGSLLAGFLSSEAQPVHEDVNLLVESSQAALPQTCKIIKNIRHQMKQEKFTEVIRDLLALPQIFTQESNKFCVLVLDEFHHMEDFGIARIFQELGHAIMTQKRSLYVLMSSCPGIAQGILSEKLSLLFGNFEVISVEPFDQKISREFIAAHLRDVKICKDLEGFIVDLTCGYPLYLKFICDEISSLGKLHQQNEIFLPLVQKAMENIVFNPWGVLHRHFDLILDRLCLGRGNSVYGSILAALSSGRKNLREIVSKVTAKKNIVSGKLNRLVEMGIIAKVGRYFYLEDKLFRFWIKYVYLKERLAFSPVNEEQGKVFCQELSAAYDAFLLNTHKDLSSRMVDLLQCCDEDSFCINGRRYKLPLFREVVPGKIQNDASFAFDVIKAKSAEGAWLIFLKAGIVGEQEIHSLLTASRGGKDKPKKFILISPVELDENARLKALQERMWIWNEGELKLFSSFYDKPFVF